MPRIDLTNGRKEKLQELGFNFANAGNHIDFHAGSLFEAPFFSVAGLHSSTPIQIGGYTLINGGSLAHLKTGRYCSMANNIAIGFAEHPIDRLTSSSLTFSHDFMKWRSITESWGRETSMETKPFVDRLLTEIGNDVWIGQGAFLKAGVKIGHGAIVAAHACVVSDVPPYAIVGGVPSKILRYRFPQEIIDRLLALSWWDYALPEFGGIDISDIEKSVTWLEKNIADFTPLERQFFSPDDLINLLG